MPPRPTAEEVAGGVDERRSHCVEVTRRVKLGDSTAAMVAVTAFAVHGATAFGGCVGVALSDRPITADRLNTDWRVDHAPTR
jgi:hypothetical protein